MLQQHFLKLSSYNYWANDQIVRYIKAAGIELADQQLISSFPSIRLTLFHIWDAERVWLRRLQGQNLENWPPSAGFIGSLEEALVEILNQSNRMKEYVEGCSEQSLHSVIQYKNTAKKDFTTSVMDILTHCFNHSTYHRGQVITLLRQVGFTSVGSTDYITYCRIVQVG